jgi:NAD-dependent dihydropyrimidine dehydrogenase PreA subunit
MQVSEECIGCEVCVPYCPMGAISPNGGVVTIDQDECVECGICLRGSHCPVDALYWPPEVEQWPRLVRKAFSDPLTPHKGTGLKGRGTEEMKTNDVTGRFRFGEFGMGMEFGRPGVGTRLSELNKMSTALAKVGVQFEPANPLSELMPDPSTGQLREDVLNEKVLSAIIEFKAPLEKLAEVISVARKVATELDTVFSWCLVSRVNPDGTVPTDPVLASLGMQARPNAKINMGLGRPLIS